MISIINPALQCGHVTIVCDVRHVPVYSLGFFPQTEEAP